MDNLFPCSNWSSFTWVCQGLLRTQSYHAATLPRPAPQPDWKNKNINLLPFRHCQRSSLDTLCLFWHNTQKHHPLNSTVKRHHHSQHWCFGNLTSSLPRSKYCLGLPFPPFPKVMMMMKSCACHFMRFPARLKLWFLTGITAPIFHRGESASWGAGMCNPCQMEIPLPATAFLTVKPVLTLPVCKSYEVTQRGWSMQGGSPGCAPLLLLLLLHTGAAMLCLTKRSCDLPGHTQQTQALQPDLKMKK